MTNVSKVWFITGVSRGLGKLLAEHALSQGDKVIGTARDGGADESLRERGDFHVFPLEVTDKAQVVSTVQQAKSIYGRLDVVVNNAGYGLLGAVENASEPESERVFGVNFFGVLNVIQAALPMLREQRSGHIVNISSIAGLAPGAGSGIYAAAKSAVIGLSESLAQEVAELGIKVTVVEPGAFRTDFLSDHSIRQSAQTIRDYEPGVYAKAGALKATAGQQKGDPAKAAAAIWEAIASTTPPLHLVLGPDALKRTRDKLAKLNADMAAWEALASGTDF
ncbi:oxidoreductase [Paenibacillus macerans]|uniref:oxidoreductase n=1 Tax=Paenibacillus macerans TaxID=44252 RepID=UPI00203E8E6C|nr:oxidoreductase [Paenibacillus macerans]MCM3697800.1 oxidoreductase [Paenibacillus macerans]